MLVGTGGDNGAADAKERREGGAGGGTARKLRLRLLLLSAAWLVVALLVLVAVLELQVPDSGDDSLGGGSSGGGGAGGGVQPPAGQPASVASRGRAIMSIRTSVCELKAYPDCTVNCYGAQPGEISASLTELFSNDKTCASAVKLHVDSCQFFNESLSSGWLDAPVQLLELSLKDCEIDSVADDAFIGTQFATLQKLFLDNISLQSLQRAVFHPLEYLEELSITKCSTLKSVEDGIAAELPQLGSLQVQDSVYSYNKRILAAFGGSERVAAIIDFRFNSLGVLHPYEIFAAVHASQVHLRGSGVTAIEVGSFPHSESLVSLFLDDNKLETLVEGSINFEKHPIGLKIYLANNPWNCNCSLLWLLKHSNQFADNPVCSAPPQYAGIPLKHLYGHLHYSCFDYSNTTATTTSAETTQSTTASTHETTDTSLVTWTPTGSDVTGSSTETSVVLSSTQHTTTTTAQSSGSSNTGPADYTTESLPTSSESSTTMAPTLVTTDDPENDIQLCIHINFSDHRVGGEWGTSDADSVRFRDIDENTVRITLSSKYAGGYIVWKHEDSTDCHETSPILFPEVELSSLKPDANYQICALRAVDVRTSIHNCHSHKTIPEYGNRVWLPNRRKPVVLGVGSSSLVVIVALILYGAFQLVYHKPNLLWKNVYVEDKTMLIVPSKPHSIVPPLPPERPPPPSEASSKRTSTSTGSTGTYITVEEPTPGERFVAERLGVTLEKVALMLRRRDYRDGWRRSSSASIASTISTTRRTVSIDSVSTAATSIWPTDFSVHSEDYEDLIRGLSSSSESR